MKNKCDDDLINGLKNLSIDDDKSTTSSTTYENETRSFGLKNEHANKTFKDVLCASGHEMNNFPTKRGGSSNTLNWNNSKGISSKNTDHYKNNRGGYNSSDTGNDTYRGRGNNREKYNSSDTGNDTYRGRGNNRERPNSSDTRNDAFRGRGNNRGRYNSAYTRNDCENDRRNFNSWDTRNNTYRGRGNNRGRYNSSDTNIGYKERQKLKLKWEEERSKLMNKFMDYNVFEWQKQMDKDYVQHKFVTCPEDLQYVGGIDISYEKINKEIACVCIVVIDIKSNKNIKYCKRVADHHKFVTITEPYIANFLAFRETKYMVQTMLEFQEKYPTLLPQVLLVDGNGTMHSKRFGSACHLGVCLYEEGLKIPTVGVAKNYLCLREFPTYDDLMDILMEKIRHVNRELLYPLKPISEDKTICVIRKPNIRNKDKTTIGSLSYISPGHMITLNVSVQLVRLVSWCCEPEPIRQADRISRELIEDYLYDIY